MCLIEGSYCEARWNNQEEQQRYSGKWEQHWSTKHPRQDYHEVITLPDGTVVLGMFDGASGYYGKYFNPRCVGRINNHMVDFLALMDDYPIPSGATLVSRTPLSNNGNDLAPYNPGEEAAFIAARTIENAFAQNPDYSDEAIIQACRSAAQRIKERNDAIVGSLFGKSGVPNVFDGSQTNVAISIYRPGKELILAGYGNARVTLNTDLTNRHIVVAVPNGSTDRGLIGCHHSGIRHIANPDDLEQALDFLYQTRTDIEEIGSILILPGELSIKRYEWEELISTEGSLSSSAERVSQINLKLWTDGAQDLYDEVVRSGDDATIANLTIDLPK